jgi:hypothetical protein
MKLNPDKCVFGVTAGKLLSFLVLHQGIVANPEKNKIIEAMQPPIHIKDVQKLWGSGAPRARTDGERYARSPPPGRVWTVQRPVYYISEVLHDAKMRYLEVHKLLYAVLIASR